MRGNTASNRLKSPPPPQHNVPLPPSLQKMAAVTTQRDGTTGRGGEGERGATGSLTLRPTTDGGQCGRGYRSGKGRGTYLLLQGLLGQQTGRPFQGWPAKRETLAKPSQELFN